MRHVLALFLTSTAALAEVPRVVTDIPPVHSITALVMGDLGTPELLLAPGAEEHDFQLKPSQVASLAEAGLVVWIGPDLTPWLDTALAARDGQGAVLTLLDDVGTYKINYFASGGEAVPEQDHGMPGHQHGHGPGAIDPHVWLDPSTASYWTGLIAAELSRLDPANAATYAANAASASATIQAAEARASALLDPVRDQRFVTYHDAYGYFINRYGLSAAGTLALGDAASPGAARLADLRRALEGGGIACLFPDAQRDPALVTQMADGTGVRIGGPLDPVGSTLEPGPGLYPALITGLAATLADCLDG